MPEMRDTNLDNNRMMFHNPNRVHSPTRAALSLSADEIGLLNIVRQVKRGGGYGSLIDVAIKEGKIVSVGKTRENILI